MPRRLQPLFLNIHRPPKCHGQFQLQQPRALRIYRIPEAKKSGEAQWQKLYEQDPTSRRPLGCPMRTSNRPWHSRPSRARAACVAPHAVHADRLSEDITIDEAKRTRTTHAHHDAVSSPTSDAIYMLSPSASACWWIIERSVSGCGACLVRRSEDLLSGFVWNQSRGGDAQTLARSRRGRRTLSREAGLVRGEQSQP
jgi:hypothetical protein